MADLDSIIMEAASSIDSGSASTETPAAETPVAETPTETTTETSAAETPAAAVGSTGDTVAETPEVKPGETTPPEDSLDTVRQELAGKRDNRIPYSRVTKIVENAEKKVEAKFNSRITELESEVAPYRTDEFRNSMRALELAETDPAAFIETLVKVDERYAKLLSGKGLAAAAPAAAATESDVKPDIQLSDGTLGYSAEASDKRVAAMLARQAAELRAEFKDQLKTYEPIQKDYQTHQLREQARERVAARLQEAAKWPGFKENSGDIGAYMEKNRGVSLHDAYIAVVIPRMQADETKIRQKIADEQKKAAKATSGVTPAAAAAPGATSALVEGVDPIEAAIHASIAGLK